ncbi:hypothetical protein RHSIM_RhsimUnG0094500 [Rhododendron simsii]|uniref:YbaK/aminoacyl-tRNA synthetase-associated domain-containing protein n=1 Tax=Rhododendron simsii TaxID=118357 RepID=A0A834FVI1_RHOSS|nr:hypothetical protein RHSIM_RhsimUnG0094500 [Rhododendron simsii]
MVRTSPLHDCAVEDGHVASRDCAVKASVQTRASEGGREREREMGYAKDQLLARLKELHIDFTKYDHPVVLTVEAQAKYVKGALSKNLFLKDKKHRFYLVSALKDTKVDLKVLSQRLGLGKAGLRMAPEEALPEVPLGCVTPFALVNDSARHVSLLLDKGFKDCESCFFHPLSNDASISLNALDLDKFLKSLGKDPSYVDLEANPSVGKDQPPDLAYLVPSDAIVLEEGPTEKAGPSKGPESSHIAVNNKPTSVAGKAWKSSSETQKEKPITSELPSSLFADPEKFVEEILERTSAIVLKEVSTVYLISLLLQGLHGLGLKIHIIQIKEETIKQHGEQLGALVSNSIRKHLSLDFTNLTVSFSSLPCYLTSNILSTLAVPK